MTSRKSKCPINSLVTCRQEQLIAEIQRTVRKRDSIKLKYNWRREDREEILSLPKLTSKSTKKAQNNTQVERNIAALKMNISRTTEKLDRLDGRLEEKSQELRYLNKNLMASNNNISMNETDIRFKKKEVLRMKIQKKMDLFKADVIQKRAKELQSCREKSLSGGNPNSNYYKCRFEINQ